MALFINFIYLSIMVMYVDGSLVFSFALFFLGGGFAVAVGVVFVCLCVCACMYVCMYVRVSVRVFVCSIIIYRR